MGQPSIAAPAVKSALAGRCPRCGRGRLFSGYLTVAQKCGHCGLAFSGHDSADGPAVFITLFLGTVVAAMALFLELRYAPPIWLHVALWPPVVIGGSLGLLRPLKAVFIGIQYKYRTFDEDTPS